MKILQLNSAKNFGGGEKHLADLSAGLIANGHDISICLRETATWRDKLGAVSDDKVFRLPLRNALDLFSAKRLAGILQAEKIEILHAHLARDYPLASFAVRLNPKTKLILTRHVLFKMSAFHRFSLTNVSRMIAVSAAVKKQLETAKTFASEKISVVHNGIEIERWATDNHEELLRKFRAEYGFSADDFLIGTVGELKPLKGQMEFVKAAQLVAQQIENARFIIAGKDNSSNKNFARELKNTVERFGLTNKFLWLDYLTETAPLLHALDVFVSASHSESFGLAILEAMAAGCAIAATKTEGATEILTGETGVCGKLVEIKDFRALAEATLEFAANENLRREFGFRAQKRSVENFGLQKMIDKTGQIYMDVLNA